MLLLMTLPLPNACIAPPRRLTCRMAEGSRFLEPDKYKSRVKEKFEKRALTYDENNAFHPRVVSMLLKCAPLKQGDAVLDVASGTGFVTFEACQVVGSSGRVVGIDISDAMVKQVCGALYITRCEHTPSQATDFNAELLLILTLSCHSVF